MLEGGVVKVVLQIYFTSRGDILLPGQTQLRDVIQPAVPVNTLLDIFYSERAT